MNRLYWPYLLLLLLLPALMARADDTKPCSTEKVNHHDCFVLFDRRYPVTLPTIQMSRGKQVIVKVQDPLPFETLSLDETSATAVIPSDQGAALVTAAIPDLKGFFWSAATLPAGVPKQGVQEALAPVPVDPCNPQTYNKPECDVQKELDVLQKMLDAARSAVPTNTSSDGLYNHIVIVYAQINQVLAPIPKPGSRAGNKAEKGDKGDKYAAPSQPAQPADAPGTPDPWRNYSDWRIWLLCELAGTMPAPPGGDCKTDSNTTAPTNPTFTNVLGDIGTYQGRLPTTPPTPPPDNVLFDQTTFDKLAKQTKADIDNLPNDGYKKQSTDRLQKIKTQEYILNSAIAGLANTLTNVQKDFLNYYQSIYLATDRLPAAGKDKNGDRIPIEQHIGDIYDPWITQSKNDPVAYKHLLGRQVVYAVNAVNLISTPVASITATSAKVSIATITVLYADPIFEMSAGALVSFVHNRTFSNQTIIKPPAGSSLTAGDIVISESKTYPEIVPFVAANWRLGPDFVVRADHRRGAFYATAFLGLNPYTTLPEYGAGPSFSWRSFMFSALYNRAHQLALTPGTYVGQPVCSPSAMAGATPPPCTPAPPAPVTQTVPTNAFAIGISIRVPTSFTAGGVSH
jgi:hypothetical protein